VRNKKAINTSIQTTMNGQLISTVSPTHGGTTLYQYDALGRQTGQKQPRHENYSTVTYNTAGQLASTTDATGATTSYVYYDNGVVGAGQLRQMTNALGHSTFHEYDLLGRETYTWGPATYPVVQGYNVYGQRNLLRTFRDTNADFSTSIFPTTATGDTTTWTYDDATGALLQKTYADGRGPSYMSRPGRLGGGFLWKSSGFWRYQSFMVCEGVLLWRAD
jgi:YD repeat-containing protein